MDEVSVSVSVLVLVCLRVCLCVTPSNLHVLRRLRK